MERGPGGAWLSAGEDGTGWRGSRSNTELRMTISVGAGPHCDGQLLVWSDWAGMSRGRIPRFVKQYANIADTILAAAEQFRPSRAPVKKPIWENVETDQLGRKILVHGDCHRVIDDPNVGSNEIFRTFGQYIVFCSNYQRSPQELPWVDEIRDRFGSASLTRARTLDQP